jgi:hypothetical protein
VTRKRIQGKYTALCGHDGCRKTIRSGTWNWPTGLCVEHQPAPEPRPKRDGVRQVAVLLSPTCSSLAITRPVSVAKEPWL